MDYYVFNENNFRQKVTDEQLEAAFLQKDELPVHIIVGMGASKAVKYLSRLKEALYYEKWRSRIDAIYSVFSIEDTEVISILKQKESSLPIEDLNTHGSEKAILQTLIIRLEGGPSAVRTAFFDPCVNGHVKFRFMSMYFSHFTMVLEDLHFVIDALEAFSRREEGWIQALNTDDYTDAVIQGLEAVSKAMEMHNLLEHLSDNYYSKLAVTGKKLSGMKLDSIAKETVAEFSKGLPPSYAYSMLEPIMNGKARGDVKRELNKSLAILEKRERYEEKEYHKLEENRMETEKYVRTPISLEQLFNLDTDLLEEYDLYVKVDMVKFEENTIVYLDDPLDVDDDTEDEIYPSFAQELDLQWFFSGQVINDIILNTRHQLTNPTVKDYIKNFTYYNENDCFLTF